MLATIVLFEYGIVHGGVKSEEDVVTLCPEDERFRSTQDSLSFRGKNKISEGNGIHIII